MIWSVNRMGINAVVKIKGATDAAETNMTWFPIWKEINSGFKSAEDIIPDSIFQF